MEYNPVRSKGSMKDLARIYIKAGDGGDGSAHLRHEK